MNNYSPLHLPLTRYSLIPPSQLLFVPSPTDTPLMTLVLPLAYKMEMEIDVVLPPKSITPELLLEVNVTPRVMRVLNKISEVFLSSVPFTPTIFMDRYPNQLSRQPALSLMTWNVQGAASPAFLTMLKELIRVNKPHVLALVETHISGASAQRICDKINFGGMTRVEAEGFSGVIWLFLAS
ncbi:hypothetical protein RND81_09G150600 [Saponaria officinalis]|uniref:Endonuclease/exonuclease/phosphatase domain-containing protein n=1 Tax=Saponaria officinalis TaxID=3572 RepID=A0AAW1IMZ3_SAPOF